MTKIINKLKHNTLFGFILGGFIFGIIGAGAATLYNSNQISYSNELSEVTNVKSAIDELYTMNNNSNKSFTLTLPMKGSYNGYSFDDIQNRTSLVIHYDGATNTFSYPTASGICWYNNFSYFINVGFADDPEIVFE